MLTTELRTIDIKNILTLWETDKKKLKIKLLDDYHMLVKEYRKQSKLYTQSSVQGSEIHNKYRTFDIINYQAELDTEEAIYGKIEFTKDFEENIKIALKVLEGECHTSLACRSFLLQEIVRLKAVEIIGVLELLNVKVSYDKDFSRYVDKWMHEDLEELRLRKIEEAELLEQERKERAEYIIEDLSEGEI